MPKGDDHLQKKKAKAVRKRMRRVGADSLEAIQGVQAAKKRRKSGTRRSCEGMCYTLPTPEDPFNERHDRQRIRKENRKLRSRAVPEGEILEFETYTDVQNGSGMDTSGGYEKQLKKRTVSEDSQGDIEADQDRKKRRKVDKETVKEETSAGKHSQNGNSTKRSPKSEHLQVLDAEASLPRKERTDLNGSVTSEAVLAAILEVGLLTEDPVKLNVVNGEAKEGAKKQGSVFGRHCQTALAKGVDVIAVSSLGWEDRAFGYVVPTAVHIKAQHSKNAALHKPLVLIMVASEDQALQVRCVFKPLKKTLGISSVCVHPGTSLDTQIRGLSMLTPDMIIATPQRLVELLVAEAVSLSKVSFMVINGLDEILEKGFQEYMSKVKEDLSQSSQKLIICGKFSKETVIFTRQWAEDPIERIVLEPNLESSSACIVQEVSVFTSADKRLPKLLKVLQQSWDKPERKSTGSSLILVEDEESVEELILAIQGMGYSATGLNGLKDSQLEPTHIKLRACSSKALVTTEKLLGQIPLERMCIVINYCFPSSMGVYKQILTGMARQSVHGVLHSFCTASMASVARDLVEVLQICGQEVPRTLQMFGDAASLVLNGKQ